MGQCLKDGKVKARLSKIGGQVAAINKMIDDGKSCEDILIQINAAKSALHKVGQMVLEDHLRHCVLEGVKNGDADATIEEFASAIEHFSRI